MFCRFLSLWAEGAIDAVPHDHLTFLVTAFGKPFTANGSGNWFHDRCKEAGIKPVLRRD